MSESSLDSLFGWLFSFTTPARSRVSDEQRAPGSLGCSAAFLVGIGRPRGLLQALQFSEKLLLTLR